MSGYCLERCRNLEWLVEVIVCVCVAIVYCLIFVNDFFVYDYILSILVID